MMSVGHDGMEGAGSGVELVGIMGDPISSSSEAAPSFKSRNVLRSLLVSFPP